MKTLPKVESIYFAVCIPKYGKNPVPTLLRIPAKPYGDGFKVRGMVQEFGYATLLNRSEIQDTAQEALDKFRASLEESCRNLRAQFEQKQAVLMKLPANASDLPSADAVTA